MMFSSRVFSSVTLVAAAFLFNSNPDVVVRAQDFDGFEVEEPPLCEAPTDEFFFDLTPSNEFGDYSGAPADSYANFRIKIRPSTKKRNPPKLCLNTRFYGDFQPDLLHLHAGNLKSNGPIVLDFSPFLDGLMPTKKGCLDVSKTTASMIINNPSEYYVNAYSIVNGTQPVKYTGMRGQLVQSVASNGICGSKEVPPFFPYYGGGGEGTITFKDAGTKACVKLRIDGFDEPDVLGHIHEGVAGMNGPVVLAYESTLGIKGNLFEGCLDVEPDLAVEILKNPPGYYLNFHSGSGGQSFFYGVRGQLTSYAKRLN